MTRVTVVIVTTVVVISGGLVVSCRQNDPLPSSSPTTTSESSRTSAPTSTIESPPSSAPSPVCVRGVHADSRCTPGALNPDVTQATIGITICVPGWTSSIRPPSSYTTRLKIRQLAEYGYVNTRPADFEEDHLIPLALGGAPRDPANLWPEPWTGARLKDVDENRLHRAVCTGRLTLRAAQDEILTKWR